MQRDKILYGKVGGLLLRLSFPAAAGMVTFSGLNLVDTFFIASLGSEALAALTLSIPMQIFIISIVSATGVGITSGIARSLGENDIKKADNIAFHSLFIVLIYALVFWILITNFIDDLLLILGTPPETFALVREYMLIMLWACIFSFIPITLGNIIQGEGDTLWPIIIALIGIGINVLLDPFLIFGFAGFAGMGLNGAAIAAVLSQIINSVLASIIIHHRKGKILSWAFRNFRTSFRVIANIYSVGFPAILMEIAGVITMTCFTRILGGYSSAAIAVLGVFLRVRSLVFMPVYGLTQGSMPIASFAYGAGNLSRVRETIIKSCFFALVYMVLVWSLLQLYPHVFIKLFIDDPMFIETGVSAVKTGTMFLPLMGPFIILLTVMQAVGKGTMAMYLSLTKQIGLMLPLLIILPRYYGINGVWISFSAADLISAVLAVFFFLKLWRELQKARKTGIVIFLRWHYVIKRIWAWIKSG